MRLLRQNSANSILDFAIHVAPRGGDRSALHIKLANNGSEMPTVRNKPFLMSQ
jgi:hypothetical protein